MAKVKPSERRDPTQTVALQIRIKEELRAQIEEAAALSGRSMNAEIAGRLEESLREDDAFGGLETKRALLVMSRDIADVERLSGHKWREDRATALAVAKVLADTVRRFEPRLANYNEGMAFLEEVNAEEGRRKDIHSFLLEIGALRYEQPNALSIFASGKSQEPYPIMVEDESKWHHWSQADEPLSEEDKVEVRKLIAEAKDIAARQPERLERLRELRKPIIEAEERAELLYQKYRRGFEAMIAEAMENFDGA